MTQFRPIKVNVWVDRKISNMNQKQKLFFIYLLTNDSTNFVGCYELSKKKVAIELGLDFDEIEDIITEFIGFGLIKYDEETSEILLINWSKHNWSGSSDANFYIFSGIKKVKCLPFKLFLLDKYQIRKGVSVSKINDLRKEISSFIQYEELHNEDRVSVGSVITNTNSNTNTINTSENTDYEYVKGNDDYSYTNSAPLASQSLAIGQPIEVNPQSKISLAKEVIKYLNEVTNSSFPFEEDNSIDLILDILSDYTIEQCKRVIDTKVRSWIRDPKMSQYLRPKTLFKRSNFENYINSPTPKSTFEIVDKLFSGGV